MHIACCMATVDYTSDRLLQFVPTDNACCGDGKER